MGTMVVAQFENDAFDISHVISQCANSLLSPPLYLNQGGDFLLGPLLGFDEGRKLLLDGCNTLFSAALGLDQLADQCGERQDLVGQHQTTELCTPLWAFLKNTDEVAKFFNGERHACLAAERDQGIEGASTGRPFNLRWQKISALTLAYTGDLCNVHKRFRMARLGGMLRARKGGRVR